MALNTKQITHLRTALEMAVKSNERMKNSKPLYAPMFDAVAAEYKDIENELRSMAIALENTKNK